MYMHGGLRGGGIFLMTHKFRGRVGVHLDPPSITTDQVNASRVIREDGFNFGSGPYGGGGDFLYIYTYYILHYTYIIGYVHCTVYIVQLHISRLKKYIDMQCICMGA